VRWNEVHTSVHSTQGESAMTEQDPYETYQVGILNAIDANSRMFDAIEVVAHEHGLELTDDWQDAIKCAICQIVDEHVKDNFYC